MKALFSKEKLIPFVLHALCVIISVGFFLLLGFTYRSSLVRLLYSLRDLFVSLGYYVMQILSVFFGFENGITPTVTAPPVFDFGDGGAPAPEPIFPTSFDSYRVKFLVWGKSLFNYQSFGYFFGNVGYVVTMFFTFLGLLLPILLLTYFVMKKLLLMKNNKYDKDTAALKRFKRLAAYTYRPMKRAYTTFRSFVSYYDFYVKLWVFVMLLNLNVVTIVLECAAYLIYLCVSLNFTELYYQVYKLGLDVRLTVTGLPWYLWLVLGYALFLRLRRNRGYSNLDHMERRNRGFIADLPICNFIVGTMGCDKTKTMTDIVLSKAIMLRNKAYESMLINDMKFPNFPWINLENAIKQEMEGIGIYNLESVRSFIARHKEADDLFGYDVDKYGAYYNDELKIVSIWEVIENYACEYFIYVLQSSLLVSNYSIREDDVLMSLGNFPVWNSEFFRRDTRFAAAYSRHSKILDFDVLRLGKKILEDNAKSGSFEFGVVVITEIGKERGNMLDTRELKKNTESANQLNDQFNNWLKLCRHSSTVDNYPYVFVIFDDQRPESLGADARELSNVLHIGKKSELRLALPFYYVEELIYQIIYPKFSNLYHKYRYKRGDNCLIMYMLKNIVAHIHNRRQRIYNKFGYTVSPIELESGKLDGKVEAKKYYACSKKIYSDRYATDCHSACFKYLAKNAKVGLADYEEYEGTLATVEEILSQNSYFSSTLVSLTKAKDTEKVEETQPTEESGKRSFVNEVYKKFLDRQVSEETKAVGGRLAESGSRASLPPQCSGTECKKFLDTQLTNAGGTDHPQ